MLDNKFIKIIILIMKFIFDKIVKLLIKFKMNFLRNLFRLIYFLFGVCVCVYFFKEIYPATQFQESKSYSFVFVNIICFIGALFASYWLRFEGWVAIFGVIFSLLIGIFLCGIVYILPSNFDGIPGLLLNALGTLFISIASAIFFNAFESIRKLRLKFFQGKDVPHTPS